ncbi:MAG: MXAN_6640 family putative metalloprotease [Bacteroidota bacterium]|jgi:hypothetical protein
MRAGKVHRYIAAIVILLVYWFNGNAQESAHRKKSIQTVLSILNPTNQIATSEIRSIKSATPLVALSHLHWNQLSVQSKALIAQSLQATETQKSRLSPSGRFRIHYDTTGSDTPALLIADQTQALPNTYEEYIDSVGAVFDYCWTFQIDSLGYNPPAPHLGPSGNPEYDIYIENIGPDTFGYTNWDDSTQVASPPNSAPRYWTYTVVDNDFLEFRTKGIDALRATAAHEFQHAIHLGGYGLWDVRDEFFFELSAGWMEGVTFPSVHDYFYDVADYFTSFRDANGSLPFFNNSEYGSERGIWGQFIAKRFGRDIMRKIWEFMITEEAMPAINDAIKAQGSDMRTEFSLFSYWNYFTADRANAFLYYPEGKNYPRFAPNSATTYMGATTSISDQAHTLSTSFYEFCLSTDTITAIVTNADIATALQYDDNLYSLQLDLGTSINGMSIQNLSNGLEVGFGVSDLSKWAERYLLASTKTDIPKSIADASPNPFLLSNAARLALPVKDPSTSLAHIFIFGSSLSLAFSGDYSVSEYSGSKFIMVPSADLRSCLSSGIYFIIARTNNSEYRWKVAIIR